jgi:Holliday junction resolvase RusA-like endonuclease
LGNVKLTIDIYISDKRRRDLDNFAKILLDSLKDIVFEDDSKVFELHMRKFIGAAIDKIIIDIEPYIV